MFTAEEKNRRFRMEVSVKNNAEALIVHTVICAAGVCGMEVRMSKGNGKCSKRTSQMLFLLLTLVVCLLVYLWAAKLQKAEEDDTGEDAAVSLADFKEDDIRRIEKTYKGETLSFVLEKYVWYYEDDRDFPLEQQFLEDMKESISSMTAARTLSEDEIDMDSFGLTNPQLTVKVTTADGAQFIYYIGNENTVTGDYYMKKETGSEVYLISKDVFNYFSDSLSDMEQTEATGTDAQ